MSQIKISDLESTTSVNEELCNVPVDDGTSTKKITLKNLMASATASAQAYAEAAAGSASDASGYATAASTSASDASGYATSAGTSATNAAGSASAASGYADTASAAASTASGSASSAALSANSAAQQVSNAENYSKLSESFAHGNTGVRAGENTDNAQYWAQVAAAAAGGGVVTFNGRTGAVVPANGDYSASQISRGTTSTVDTDLTSAENAITAIKGDIAPSEDGDTALQGYSKGDQFLRNGTLYKAKTAIVAGDTFVLDTNYELAADVSSQIKTLETSLDGKINTTDIANNLTTATAGKVLDATQGKALNDSITNKHKITRKTVDTSSWTSDTSSQSGTTLYKKSISLSHVYVDSPSVDISTSSGSGLPTTAQQEAYDLVQYVTVDGTTMYLYASAIPSTTFYIQIEGVD